ncbi:MAG: hypothetical protein PHI16_05860, partial [Methanocellales archaeon]|nr:hypothetical protein [Methanocellales archaeon]
VIGTSSTFVIVSIVGGIRYAYAIYGTSDGPSWEMLVSMLAVCMVASMIILEFVLYRLRD